MLVEYSCLECDNVFDELVSTNPELDLLMVWDPITEQYHEVRCPKCKSTDVKRNFSAPALSFKGSGFYSTDYKPVKPKNGQGDK